MYTVVCISETILMQHTGSMSGGYYGRLGRRHRKIIPSCVVSIIRKEFPEAVGNYTGFKDPSVTEADPAFL